MSNFNFDAYEKVYPVVEEAPKPIETAVEGFTPTADHIEDVKKPLDNTAGVADKVTEGVPTPDIAEEKPAEGETNG